MGRVHALVLVGLAASFGCDGGGAPPSGRLAVAAASSLRELVEATRAAFEASHPGAAVAASFDASSTLARQIDAGAAYDVFLSADAATVERVRSRAVPGSIAPFLSNLLVVVAREGLANPPGDAAALGAFEGRLALAGPAVPAGRYARAYLERKGLLGALLPRAVNADSVRAALALVESGAADLAIVYETDARVARRARRAYAVPEADDPGVVYVACALAGAGDAAAAAAYLEFLESDAFRRAALDAGFRLPAE